VTFAKRSLRFARVGVDGRVLALERIGDGEGGPDAVDGRGVSVSASVRTASKTSGL
jgi:hypothetical protein